MNALACFCGKFFQDCRGSTAIMMALLMPFTLAGLAFGSELGFWQLSKRRLQNASDTAAFAAATQLRSGLDQSDLEAAALLIAEQSGFDSSTGTISVASPPVSGAYSGNNNALVVSLTQTLDRKFSQIFDQSAVNIPVSSTVLINNGRPACILALAPSEPQAAYVKGSTTVTLVGCDVAANSISNTAVDMQGSASLETDCVSAVGGVSATTGLTLNDCAAPIENGPVTADPYKDRPDPIIGSCLNKSQWKKNHGVGKPSPGTYCNGNNTNGRVSLDPGVYVLKGGTWKFNATSDVTGTDVTLFLTDGAEIDINGSADFQISAPTTGDYSGLAIYIDRDDDTDHKINGGSGFSLTGAIYGAGADIEFTGNTTGSGAGDCTQVIAYTITFSGNSGFDSDCSNSGTTEIKTAQSIKVVE